MASSRFVTTTLNGMFLTQLAAWMTTPMVTAAMAHDQPPLPKPTHFSRADDDPATSLDDGWKNCVPTVSQSVFSVGRGDES
jgi:hypothetical protein